MCRGKVMPGTDPPLCSAHLGRSGRTSLLTDELADKLVALVAAGNFITTALVVVGVGKATFYAWLDRGDPAGQDAADEPYRELRARMETARAEGIALNVSTIQQAAKKDWRAGAWLLERTDPERFSRSGIRARTEDGDGEQQAAGAVDGEDADPFADIPGDELAPRRAGRASAG